MSTVVVTGGAGFIGSNLSKELAKLDYKIVIIDDLSTGKIENITPILNKKNVEFHQVNVTDYHQIEELLRGTDYVFHSAAIASVPRSIDNPKASHDVNATGTLNVLLAARNNGVRKVIFASSSAVYGDASVPFQREDMIPAPQSPYAVSKLIGEYYCYVFQKVYALPTVCLRYFNVYGPGQMADSQYAAVIPKFIEVVSQQRPPVIFGDGSQTRDFVFIKDVVSANILSMRSEFTGVVNIGSGVKSSLNQLTQFIIGLVGNNVKPVYAASRAGDITHSLADISRARASGYEPNYSLEEGLRQTINEYRK